MMDTAGVKPDGTFLLALDQRRHMFTRFFALVLCLPAAVSADAAAGTADARFQSIYTKEWSWRQSFFGREEPDSSGYRKISPKLPVENAAAQDARLAYWTDVMRQLDQIDKAGLSVEERTNY